MNKSNREKHIERLEQKIEEALSQKEQLPSLILCISQLESELTSYHFMSDESYDQMKEIYKTTRRNDARPYIATQTYEQLQSLNEGDTEEKCKVCGCSWFNACPGGCYWVEKELCTRCFESIQERQDSVKLLQLLDKSVGDNES